MKLGRVRASALAFGLAGMLCVLTVTPGAAATTLNWKGQIWDLIGATGTAALDGSGNAVITRTSGTGDLQLHVNRVEPAPGGNSSINANNTPWIQVSYLDNGQSRGVDFFIDDETLPLNPRLQAGSLFNCQGLGYVRYGSGSGLVEEVVFGEGAGCGTAPPPSVGARVVGQAHTIYVGQRADGTIDYNYDGEWFTSTFLKDQVGSFDFNDVYLRLRGDSGTSATFTDFQSGNDHHAPLANKDDCKNNGWQTSRFPTFKNQGDCVSYTSNGG